MGYRNYSVAAGFTVDAGGTGDFTTIASALAAASSGTTIFIRPGTYTENLSLKAGVNLTAFPCDAVAGADGSTSSSNVTIIGKLTATYTGNVSISDIQLQTNSDFSIVVSGSNATMLYLTDCYLNALNNTSISYTNSNTNSRIGIYTSSGNLGTTGIGYFAHSSAGTLDFIYFNGFNTGLSITTSTQSAGTLNIWYSTFGCAFGLSNTANLITRYSKFSSSTAGNIIAITTSNSATVFSELCAYDSGSASAISIGVGTTFTAYLNSIHSSNTNAITGAGTLVYGGLTFTNSSTINVTTQTGGTIQGGVFQAPSAGFLGEQIRSGATAVSMTDSTPKTIASVNLTAGVWDLSVVFTGSDTTPTLTGMEVAISTTTNSFAGVVLGDTAIIFSGGTALFDKMSGSIPAFRVTLTATTTYYLVAQINGSGTLSGNGRISGTRVG